MHGETADRILQTAHTLIADRGYAGFSYADIADDVQISKASIHHHFPTKVNLVVSVLMAHRGSFIANTQRLAEEEDDPMGRLRAYVGHWEGCIRDQTRPFCIAALLAAELPSLPEEVQAEVQAYFLELSGWLRRTLEDGVKKQSLTLEGSAEDEAQTFMALVHGAMLSARALQSAAVFHRLTAGALQRFSM
jgi:TetR/AcrR family transcriptional repressor of nem operon